MAFNFFCIRNYSHVEYHFRPKFTLMVSGAIIIWFLLFLKIHFVD